jgi:UDP-N-acetylmuramate: L-alanyl-gamma-D-glutamyl-meso-diaminopimelate ligase
MKKRIHFIAIGGALMHNLALALHEKGYQISGSDDEIYDPSRSRLSKAGLLPAIMGWHPEQITSSIDAIILGMHARPDNPELLRAQELGITIYSYPEYLYEQSQEKTRVVVGGSHGKTTTTSMIMHILSHHQIDFDYAVGAQLEGFDLMVRLSDAPLIVIEGDEYLSSPIDRRPKFLHYQPHIAVLTGVAWDHINVFPTFEEYKIQFQKFIESIDQEGTLIYYKGDEHLVEYAKDAPVQTIAYTTPPFVIKDYQTNLLLPFSVADINAFELQIFGQHNLQNLQAARLVCRELGLSDGQILEAIQSFGGAAKRLETLVQKPNQAIFKDFAHAPSKVKATIKAVKNQYENRILVAALELHTFSSLNKQFLEQYRGAMEAADVAFVYYSHHTLEMKKLPAIDPTEVQVAFEHSNLTVFTDKKQLEVALAKVISTTGQNLLLMSSGNWNGMKLDF